MKSRFLGCWTQAKKLNVILSKLKFTHQHNQWFHTKLCFNINLAMCGLPTKLKTSSHKTWQISLLFLKPLQIQNLKRKKWGDMAYYVPPVWKSGGTHVPRVPHQIAPMADSRRICICYQRTSPKRWFGNMSMTSNCDVQTAYTKYKWPPYATEQTPMKIFCVAYASGLAHTHHALVSRYRRQINMFSKL